MPTPQPIDMYNAFGLNGPCVGTSCVRDANPQLGGIGLPEGAQKVGMDARLPFFAKLAENMDTPAHLREFEAKSAVGASPKHGSFHAHAHHDHAASHHAAHNARTPVKGQTSAHDPAAHRRQQMQMMSNRLAPGHG